VDFIVTVLAPAREATGIVMRKYLLRVLIVLSMASLLGMCSLQVEADGLNPATLINATHSLQPQNYVPPNLVVPSVPLTNPPSDPEMQLAAPAAQALTKLFAAAQAENITLALSSGYRSYNDQALLYTDSLASEGTMATEAVAPPGASEHQTGLAADVILSNYFCAAQGCFALTRAAAWLQQHAVQYGFIVRYPLYGQASTGYEYEPWHLRYLGTPLADRVYDSQKTLEEFYGLL
jgi:zinc D-Ala-D-Ala carboxypeptidase